VAVSKHRAISYELRSSETSWWSPQNLSETKKFIKKKTTAGTGSDFEQAQGHQLWAHKLKNKLMVTPKFKWKEKKIIKKKTTMGIGSGFEQAQGHQLCAYMFTIKLMVSSKLTWQKIN
jgi:hypothetical protein